MMMTFLSQNQTKPQTFLCEIIITCHRYSELTVLLVSGVVARGVAAGTQVPPNPSCRYQVQVPLELGGGVFLEPSQGGGGFVGKNFAE